MKHLIVLILLAIHLPGTAMAEDWIKMTIRNDSSRPSNIAGVYQIRNGEAIDDNLGSTDTIQPGETVSLQLGLSKCYEVQVQGWLGQYPDPMEEVIGKTDLCKNRTMILHD